MEISNKQFREIKSYNKFELQNYLESIHTRAFKEGAKAGASLDFKIKALGEIGKVKGIGEEKLTIIWRILKEME